MPASIEDVAKLANVSISTVSRVVNRRALVNDETCKRVEAAIRELRYRPNAFARGLMLRKSGIVGLVLPDLHGEFYSEIIRGANAKAREMGHNLLLSSALPGDDVDGGISVIGQHALVDGLALMVSDTMVSGIGQSLTQLRIPLVVLDDEIEGVEHDAVIIDQRQGATAMMRHLLEDRGAKRVFFVGGVQTNIDTQARHKAYRDSLRKAGIKYNKTDVYHLDYTYESAYRLALEKVVEWSGPNHVVFAANDEMAAGIIAGAISQKIRVPQDLGVVGFDDTRVAQMTNPLLTTVHVPMSRMGATAIELLCARIAEPTRPVAKVVLEAELVVRDSCGHAARKK
jgi:DNA-binding LacI/PurR family transcriptional regulator